jgi:VanZ family protein
MWPPAAAVSPRGAALFLRKLSRRRDVFLKQRVFVFYWMPVILYAAFILAVSSIPGSAIKLPFSFFDKGAHLVEYGLLSLLVGRAVRAGRLVPKSAPGSDARVRADITAAAITVAVVVAFGAIDETYQSTRGRDSDIYDLTADAVGACIVQGVVVARSKGKRNREREESERSRRMIAR